jgi:GH43 family beta-xylosidase
VRALQLLLVCVLCLANATQADHVGNTFQNPILDAASDPWVIRHTDGFYYYCGSAREQIYLLRSKTLTGLGSGDRKVVRPRQPPGPDGRQIWAPELHRLDGAWYIYFAASDGDNRNHRMYVLENRAADPFEGSFVEKGRIIEPGGDRWAIDGTVLEHGAKRYFVWSSALGEKLDPQVLRIAAMTSPWTLASPTVEISRPTHHWERRGDPDVNEGPQALTRGDRTFLVYSASGSWTDDYCLGLLSLKDRGDPLDPAAWIKHPTPVFQSANGVYGPGHASFTQSPDGAEDWIVYHAARAQGSGWDRDVRTQRFGWTQEGRPEFGAPVSIERPLQKPSGE